VYSYSIIYETIIDDIFDMTVGKLICVLTSSKLSAVNFFFLRFIFVLRDDGLFEKNTRSGWQQQNIQHIMCLKLTVLHSRPISTTGTCFQLKKLDEKHMNTKYGQLLTIMDLLSKAGTAHGSISQFRGFHKDVQ
jgi:hypothetical protein